MRKKKRCKVDKENLNDNNNNKEKKEEMVNSNDLSLHSCTAALDLVTEFILIAQFWRESINIKNNEISSFKLAHTQFMNSSLRKYLHPTPNNNNNNSSNNSNNNNNNGNIICGIHGCKCGEVVILAKEDGKHYCTVHLHNFNELELLHATCHINFEGAVCTLKLYKFELEECSSLSTYFDSLETYLTIVELGPDDGTYEWRHVRPNKFTLNFHKPISFEKLTAFTAHERNSLRERRHFFAACVDCKLHGITSPKVNDVTDTYLPLLGISFKYIGPHPVTKRDLFACVVFDPVRVQLAHDRIKELGDFFENAPMLMGAVLVEKNEMTTVYANKFAASFIGLNQPILLDLKLKTVDVFSDETRHIFLSNFLKARESSPVQYQIGIPDHTGKYHFLSTTVSTITYDKAADKSMHTFIMIDRSEQRRAELELEAHKNSLEETVRMRTLEVQEKELRFRSLVSNAPNIILSINRNGLIEYANRPFNTNIENQEEDKLEGKFLHSLVVDGPILKEKIDLLFENNKSFITEVKLVESDTWLNISAGPMSRDTAIIVATDITETKKIYEELHHALTTKSRFLANMSHEVRTPLSGIIGMSRILLESGLTMDQAECAATIAHCGESLLHVINDVLDYTKLEATGMTLDNAEFSIRQCIEESIYTVLPAAQKKNLELIIDIEPYIPHKILGDMIRLRQVIVNLLNNAVKFTDSGYVMISLSALEITGTDEWQYRCSIKDTGCGIPPESQGKLFQMFSQVDSSTTRRYGGTGIGLALAKRFLEMMNGHIMMESAGISGMGSTFTFTLEACVAPFTTQTVAPTPSSSFPSFPSLSSLPSSLPPSVPALSPHSPRSPLSPISQMSPLSPSSSFSSACVPSSPRWLVSTTHIFILDDIPIACEILKKRLMSSGFVSVQVMPPGNIEESFDQISQFISNLSVADNKKVLLFCNADKISPNQTYPLLCQPNVAAVLMGYIPPSFNSSDFPNFEFLRKPIKQSAFIRCLREIWCKFFGPTLASTTPSTNVLSRVPSSNSISLIPSPSPSPAPSTPPASTSTPLNILVVEDNEVNQRVVRRVFKHLNYSNISVANHGQEALDMIEKYGLPDLILMDVQMPVLDGVQTTKIIRQKYSCGEWPYIVSLTADAFPEDRKNCLEAGMNDFLTKPIRVEQVQAILQKCYKLKEAASGVTH